MKKTTLTPLAHGKPWPRRYLTTLLRTALAVEESRFARQAALAWLTHYPGDLPVYLMRANALFQEGLSRQALPLLEQLCRTDPEYLGAQEVLTKVRASLDPRKATLSQGNVLALGGEIPTEAHLQIEPHIRNAHHLVWTKSLSAARQSLGANKSELAAQHLQLALAEDPQTPLVAVTHLQILAAQEAVSLKTLAEHYHQRWPECLQIQLLLADALMEADPDRAVTLLHQVVARDITAQVATRLWERGHPYSEMWPRGLEAPMDIQIPAAVSAALGWNLLVGGPPSTAQPASQGPRYVRKETESDDSVQEEPTQPEPTPSDDTEPTPPIESDVPSPSSGTPQPSPDADSLESLRSVEEDLEYLAERLKQPDLVGVDGRFPIYVIFSTRKGLGDKYGNNGAEAVNAVMGELAMVVREKLGWGSLLVFGDDPASMAKLGLKPAPAKDPWALKLVLADLDKVLTEKGAMIGSLLIVGGPQVVPFHHLPNPTDDDDADVPSDNPYATRDENYFVPEWPVGRIPDGTGNDPSLLISALQRITARHAGIQDPPKKLLLRIWAWLKELFHPSEPDLEPSFGYTAEVWKRAAVSVFRTIGEPGALVSSPPKGLDGENGTAGDALSGISLPTTQLAYFNLHGVADGSDWYGERDPAETHNGPVLPVALRPQDVVNGGKAPQVVFSEACYGANILDKSIEGALALKFLASGSQIVVGSTVVAYGSIAPPLNAADLLGKAFWKYLGDGFPAGDALRRAKFYLAQEMHNKQGYIDGEDQKTLISFVLYGDPLSWFKVDLKGALGWIPGTPRSRQKVKNPKKVYRSTKPAIQVKTVCDRSEFPGTSEPIPTEVVDRVKRIVDQYLPGMRGAQLSLSHEHAECCCEGHSCPTRQLGNKTRPDAHPTRQVVTLRKQVVISYGGDKDSDLHVHQRYARVTLDKRGRIVKLAVSR